MKTRCLLFLISSFFLFSCKKEKKPEELYIPDWVFKHWVWEDEGTTASATQLADDYISNGIPVDAIIIDSPWETGYNTFLWDNSLYPDAQGMIDNFHSKNIKVVTWITGVVNIDAQPLYDSMKAANFFMQNAKVFGWWKGDGSLFDYWNPQLNTWLKGRMDNVLNMGIDGWKCDGTDYYSLFTPYSNTLRKDVSRNDYSKMYYQFFNDYTKLKRGKDALVMARPIDNYGVEFLSGDIVAFADKNMIFAGWVGDQDATFEGLRKALNNMYHSSKYGYLIFGSDIGGYREDDTQPLKRSKELFIRWAQLGAFSGLMENGGGGEHRPWKFDSQTKDIYKRLVEIRNQLVPYLSEEAKKAYQSKHSLMQFLNAGNFSYLLGEDIFIAPITNINSTIKFTFPTGNNWVYLFDKSKVFTGGETMDTIFPMNEFPVYIKENSKWLGKIN